MPVEPLEIPDEHATGEDPPVTVLVARRAAPGNEAALETALREAISWSSGFQGHGGAHLVRPTSATEPVYRVFFRFDARSRFLAWRDDPRTRAHLATLDRLTEGAAHATVLTGMEAWFAVAASPSRPPPPRYKAALVTWLGLYPTVAALIFVLGPVTSLLPSLLATAVVTATAVVLMTWVVGPLMTRLFRPFLYPA